MKPKIRNEKIEEELLGYVYDVIKNSYFAIDDIERQILKSAFLLKRHHNRKTEVEMWKEVFNEGFATVEDFVEMDDMTLWRFRMTKKFVDSYIEYFNYRFLL